MSKQVHAPPTPAEDEAVAKANGYRRAPTDSKKIRAWSELRGWCSCCLRTNRPVAHMGGDRHNFALCLDCIARLAGELDCDVTMRVQKRRRRA